MKTVIKKVVRLLKNKAVQQPHISLPLTYNVLQRFLYFKRTFELVKHLEGDIVECGVGRGNSLLMFAFLAKEEMKKRKIWCFDSFEGFPEPSPEDASARKPQKGDWGDTDVNTVMKLLLNSGLDRNFIESNITFVKGFFDESLSKYKGKSIALLHLDVDLYNSYLTTLKELYPKVVAGGIILFDEYVGAVQNIKFPGAQKAIDEYLGAKSSLITRDEITGKYYLIKKNS